MCVWNTKKMSGTTAAVVLCEGKGCRAYAHLAVVGIVDRETTDELSVLVAGDFELPLELE